MRAAVQKANHHPFLSLPPPRRVQAWFQGVVMPSNDSCDLRVCSALSLPVEIHGRVQSEPTDVLEDQ